MADLVKQIDGLANEGGASLTDADRSALLQATYRLSRVLENPFEMMLRMCLNIYEPISLRLAVDLKLPDIAIAHQGAITISKLAQQARSDSTLILRIVRMLVAMGFFAEDGPDGYTTTPMTPALATGSPLRAVLIHMTHITQSITKIPEYYAAHGYQNPTDAEDGPFQFAFDCKGSNYFDYLSKPENELYSKAFNESMKARTVSEGTEFVPSYPAKERLWNDDPNRVLLVDIGGSMGHQIMRFQKKFPSLCGELILEDLPQVVDAAIEVPDSILKVGHDFFKPQPSSVKGAKAYYLRSILHDWPDKQAKIILSNIVDAMAVDSLVLIHEVVVPDRGVDLREAKLDWHMMNLNALERTESQWIELGKSVGLEYVDVYWDRDPVLGRTALLEFKKV